MGNIYQEQGDIEAAIKQVDIALSHNPERAGWRINKALLMPVIPHSEEDIEKICYKNIWRVWSAVEKAAHK